MSKCTCRRVSDILYSYILVMGDPVYCLEDPEYRKDRAAPK